MGSHAGRAVCKKNLHAPMVPLPEISRWLQKVLGGRGEGRSVLLSCINKDSHTICFLARLVVAWALDGATVRRVHTRVGDLNSKHRKDSYFRKIEREITHTIQASDVCYNNTRFCAPPCALPRSTRPALHPRVEDAVGPVASGECTYRR